jgi:enolase-phosphatase E1
MSRPNPAVLLLDIEGTTSPIDFVLRTLFPYAHQRVGDFLRDHQNDQAMQADIAKAWDEYQADAGAADCPAWRERNNLSQAAAYFRWLIDKDRKSPALKSLQGRIWQHGYDQGDLKGDVYPDVPGALERWKSEGRRVVIYSSGSVLAQKLLFRTTVYGDLTTLIDAHFDTAVGAKREAASYARIAEALSASPATILFVSDITAELDAAATAGMRTALSVRPGMSAPDAACTHPVAHTLDEALPPTVRS